MGQDGFLMYVGWSIWGVVMEQISIVAGMDWIRDNREWLFQGVGLSLSLFCAGLLWKGIRLALMSVWMLLVMLVSRLPWLRSAPEAVPGPEISSSVILPTPEDRSIYEKYRLSQEYLRAAQRAEPAGRRSSTIRSVGRPRRPDGASSPVVSV